MSLINKLESFFRKGGAKMGIGKALVHITDDPRIDIDPEEYKRIHRDFRYYSGNHNKYKYQTSMGVTRERPFNGVNMTKRVAQRLASIVFNEQCEISFDDDTLGDFINDILAENDFKNNFEMNLEKGIATGGFAARPYVDKNKIKIAWIRANQFYPLQSNTNDISEATIASVTTRIEHDDTIYYTLLEFHQWQQDANDLPVYTITNELYRSDTVGEVGTQVPLNHLEKYVDLEPVVVINGAQMVQPLFDYFRMPGANNINIESPLGIGVVDNNKHTLDNLDKTHDSFMWEIRMGKRRVLVPSSMLKTDDIHKPVFDTEDDVYESLPSEDDIGITDLTSEIRTQQFVDSINYWLKELEEGVGLAAGTFSFDPKTGMNTATGVVSLNSMTYQTRSSVLTNVTAFIEDLCVSIMETAMSPELFDGHKALWTNGNVNLNDLGIHVHYDDGVFVDKDKQMEEDLKNVIAGTLSKQTFLQRNYGLSETDAEDELAKIQDEQPQQPDSFAGTENTQFGGGDGD